MPEISQKKLASLTRRATSAAKRGAVAGAKGSRLSIEAAAVGAASEYGQGYLAEHVDYVSAHWWAGPAVLAVAGHVLRRRPKRRDLGIALLGAAGYAATLAWRSHEATVKANETTGVIDTTGVEVQGLPDTAPAETGYLPPADQPVADYVGSAADLAPAPTATATPAAMLL